jgi:hypothetical protein
MRASLLLAGLLISAVASGRCGTYSTEERLANAGTVVHVSVVDVRDGFVPWPYRWQKGALPGKLLKLRVLRSWKGTLVPGNIIYGWTAGPSIEDTFEGTELAAQTIVFYPPGSTHELMSCFTVTPGRIQEVTEQLDKSVGAASKGVNPNNSLERTRGR